MIDKSIEFSLLIKLVINARNSIFARSKNKGNIYSYFN